MHKLYVLSQLELRENFPGRVGVVGLAENKANSAPIELELELRLSLAKKLTKVNKKLTKVNKNY